MKPFFLLISAFLAGILISFAITGTFNERFCGKMALSLMLLLTAFGHFKFVNGLVLIIPRFIPGKDKLIYLTGILEILFAILLWIDSLRYEVCMMLIMFFIAVFPADIKRAFMNVNIEQANYEGPGPSYLWFRIPLQFLLLFWVYVFCL